MKRLRLLLIMFLLLLLAGCLPAKDLSPEIETDGDKTIYHYWNNYASLNNYGVIKVDASAGKTLHIDFKTEVNGGRLELKVLARDNTTLWTAKMTNSGLYSADIPVEQDGIIQIFIRARHTSGSYDVKYYFTE